MPTHPQVSTKRCLECCKWPLKRGCDATKDCKANTKQPEKRPTKERPMIADDYVMMEIPTSVFHAKMLYRLLEGRKMI